MTQVIVVGSFVQDLAFQTATFPGPGETRIGTFFTGPGGKGFNQAVACRRLGPAVRFIGAVGSDVFADSVRVFAKNEGLETSFEIVDGLPTGAASIVVNEQAENMIVVALGANERLSEAHVLSNDAHFRSAKIVITQLESSLAASAAALRLAKNFGALAILNPAPINGDVTEDLLQLADILTPNETELAFLLQHFGISPLKSEVVALSDPELHDLSRKLSKNTVVITLGAAGAFVSLGEEPRASSAVTPVPYYRVPPISVQPIDTTGAGDAFCGGLAAALLEFPNDLAAAVRYANTVAGLSTQKKGTAPAMPLRCEVERKLTGD
ncbi:MAG: ribokinase [Bdellovibrionota bacterium]